MKKRIYKSNKTWTHEEYKKLIKLLQNGATIIDIAHQLGTTTTEIFWQLRYNQKIIFDIAYNECAE